MNSEDRPACLSDQPCTFFSIDGLPADRLGSRPRRGGGDRRRRLHNDGRLWNLGLPRLVFSPELALIHRRIEAPEQFNRDTQPLVLDPDRRIGHPLGTLWPETGVAS